MGKDGGLIWLSLYLWPRRRCFHWSLLWWRLRSQQTLRTARTSACRVSSASWRAGDRQSNRFKVAVADWIPHRRPHLEQALPLGQGGAVHGPKVNVRFSTGDNQVGVHRMKHGSQYGIIGALQKKFNSFKFRKWINICRHFLCFKFTTVTQVQYFLLYVYYAIHFCFYTILPSDLLCIFLESIQRTKDCCTLEH